MNFAPLGFYKPYVCKSNLNNLTHISAFSTRYWIALPVKSDAVHLNTRSRLLMTRLLDSPLMTSVITPLSAKLQELFTLITVSLSFTGKGYRLVKNLKNTLAFSFGYSHAYYLYNPISEFRFRTKTRGFFLGLTKFAVFHSLKQLYLAKPINIYTGRGVRARRQLVKRKVGKVSLYM